MQERFVCVRRNLEGDPSAGESIAHEPGEEAGSCIRGNGEHNVQLLLLSPEGKLLSVLAGYTPPKDLLEELEFVLALKPGRIGAAHEAFIEKLEEREWKGPLGEWEKRRALADHRFAIRNAGLDGADFRPEALLGNARTYFSSRKGGQEHEPIGGDGESK